MKPTIYFRWETWGFYVKEVLDQLQVEFKPFLRDEMKRMLEIIVTLTPPDNTDQGTKATKGDIGRIAQPMLINAFREPALQNRFQEISLSHDAAAFAAFTSRMPSLQGATLIRAADVPALHQRMRNNRGRINPGVRLRNLVIGGDDINALRAYIARKVSHVGMAIGGWMPALFTLGGELTKNVSVGTAAGEHGGFREDWSDPTSPSFDAINSTPWAARRDEGSRIIRNAQLARIQALKTRYAYLTTTVAKQSAHKQAA